MNIEKAIRTAIEYEIRVREAYVEAMEETSSKDAKRIYELLAEEEHDHVRFLEANLKSWTETGELSVEMLKTMVPKAEEISAHVQKVEHHLDIENADSELVALEKAYKVEVETSEFYTTLCKELDEKGKQFFKRFMEIEQGHVALLAAEIGALSNDGFWFDFPEFKLENQ